MTRVPAIHYLGAGCIRHDGLTACGILASYKIAEGEYMALGLDRPIKVAKQSWIGVTCKRCLRNPHAPGGRHALALSSQDPVD